MPCSCFKTRTSSPDPPGTSGNKTPDDKNGDVNKKLDDPRIPLNTRQKFLLVKNWKGISRKATDTGAHMFVKMLTENPDLYDMFVFRVLKKESKEAQLDNEVLQKHGEAVMEIFDQAISAIENADTFFMILDHNGRTHAIKTGFRPCLFWKMEEPFLYAVKFVLQDRYTDNMDDIYRKVIKLILDTMEQSCQKAAANCPHAVNNS